MKKLIATFLLLALLITPGCASSEQTNPSESIGNQPTSNKSTPVETTQSTSQETLTPEESIAKDNFATSTPENDTDMGLRGIKVDTAEYALTDEQKAVIEYFDNDYFFIDNDTGYEFLQRYPQVYEGSQIELMGIIKKVISYSTDSYQVLIQLIDSEAYFQYWNPGEDYQSYLQQREGDLVVVDGTASSTRLIEGDYIRIYGRYNSIETIQVDATSYTLPLIQAHRADIIPNDAYITPDKFDIKFVKSVAKAIFGNDIEVREPIFGEDIPPAEELGTMFQFQSFCIVELENQTNSKFTKYRFGLAQGSIEDAKTGMLAATPNYDIIRELEFASDFEHFFVFTYDTSLETLNLDYYDKDLNKIWNREFEETTSAVYDYTKNNIYLAVNNELYIINTETGEDTFSPQYVGPKVDIRKLPDGILVVSESKSDGVMKLSLDGSVVWKTNLAGDVSYIEEVQLIEDKIVLSLELLTTDSYIGEVHYLVLNLEDGSVILDAISKS